MNIQKELQINMHQAVVCFDGTDEVGNFLQAAADRCGYLPLIISEAYTYGVIQGKREERARRRGKRK
ncbi:MULTISPECIES: hypothetical protein [Clostridium]|jgi:hypothetical protein|uniref:hypothetical protein n=1 Tax=Clostridium TaxID=1485 RepID=UPI000E47FDF6|nr:MULTISPECIES: hypothetical protein [Clostridium]RHV30891.1 hypothetical protein DXB56_12340 [Clostridium sp. OM04-7]